MFDPRKRVAKGVYNRTLKVVNQIRVKCGLKPLKTMPKGEPGDIYSCPIARALEPLGAPSVSGSGVYLTVKQVVKVPNPFDGDEEIEREFEGHANDIPGVDDSVFDEFVEQFDGDDEEDEDF